MSWQKYVDEHLVCDLGRGTSLSSAAIIGLDGSVRAQSQSFPRIKPQEVSAIVKNFEKPGSLAATGMHIEGAEFTVTEAEPGAVIRGRKGSEGVTVKKTTSAMIIGIHNKPVTARECDMVVERLGDYFIDLGV